MPVSVVIGGQFGSEGKGKVAHALARHTQAIAAVRVGGTNSGHTVVRSDGSVAALRQLPSAIADSSMVAVLPSGSYIDVDILLEEIRILGLDTPQVAISPYAKIITPEHKKWEKDSELGHKIGSTQSGTGAAVLAAVARGASSLNLPTVQAIDHPALQPYVRDTVKLLRQYLKADHRVVIEGTQGFGLSLLHGGHWPKATSRDTTASAFVAEAGLSPRDVDDITLVLRAYPIRVAGDSGPLPHEVNWSQVAARAALPPDFKELTTVTKKERRVASFDAAVVLQAIEANNPTRIVLNHLDYVDPTAREGTISPIARRFIERVEAEIGRRIDWLGIDPSKLIDALEEKLINRNSVFSHGMSLH